jgi:ribosomal protein S18 acetylase RimI-like enzyme|tara:strand:+ start:270 stop:752 length:483 start_codon:yes stop_codon:yes gene_type:complete
MNEVIELRLARYSDIRTIARMSRDLVEQGLGWSWRAGRIAAMINQPEAVVLVAKSHFETVGFAIMEFHEHHGHLNLLAVKPNQRRSGTGRAMLQWLEKTARYAGIAKIYLEVRARNRGARAFYERLGWENVSYVAGYYRGRESAMRMVRVLIPPDQEQRI